MTTDQQSVMGATDVSTEATSCAKEGHGKLRDEIERKRIEDKLKAPTALADEREAHPDRFARFESEEMRTDQCDATFEDTRYEKDSVGCDSAWTMNGIGVYRKLNHVPLLYDRDGKLPPSTLDRINFLLRKVDYEVHRADYRDVLLKERQALAIKAVKSAPRTKEDMPMINESLQGCLVIQREITRECMILRREPIARGPGMYVFIPSLEAYPSWFEQILKLGLNHYHEVRKHGFPIKAAFDLDGGKENMDAVRKESPVLSALSDSELRSHLAKWIQEKIITVLHSDYGVDILPDQIAICDSSNEKKFSMHVIVAKEYFFSSDNQAREFQTRVMLECAKDKAESNVLDKNCCMSTFSTFRAPLNAKAGEDSRIMRPVNCTVADAMLGVVRGTQIRNVEIICRDTCGYSSRFVPEGIEEQIYTILKNRLDMSQYKLRNIPGTFMAFDRECPGVCGLCARVHDHEGFYAFLAGNKVMAGCFAWHHKGVEMQEKSVLIGTLPFSSIAIQVMIAKSNFTMCPPSLCSLPNQVKYEEERVKEYDFGDANTMFIRSPMGSEKTKALIRYIDKVKPERILVISPRISFSEDMMTKIRSLEDYRRIDNTIDMATHKHVIVQLESLWRVRCSAKNGTVPDLLILDEAESVISQLRNKILIRKNRNQTVWAVLENLLDISKKIIAMDAFLDNGTLLLLSERKGKVVSQVNTYPALQDKSFVIMDKDLQIALILKQLAAGMNLAFICTSKKHAKRVIELAKLNFPDKQMRLFCGDNKAEMERSLGIDQLWDGYVLLVYTSTFTVGASFEKKHYNAMHAYFHNNSASVLEGMQMMGRIRDISTDQYYLSFNESYFVNIPTEAELEKMIEDSYACTTEELKHIWHNAYVTSSEADKILAEVARMTDGVHCNDEGIPVPKIRKDLQYHIYMYNLRRRLSSQGQFVYEMCKMIAMYGGYIMTEDDKAIKELLGKDADMVGANKVTLKALDVVIDHDEAVKVSIAPDITDTEYQIMERTSIAPEKRPSFTKHQLQMLYGVQEMTPEWIMEYGSLAARDVWTNLRMLTCRPTIGESLAHINEAIIRDARGKTALEIVDMPDKRMKVVFAMELLRDNGFDYYPLSSFEGAFAVESLQLEDSLRKTLPSFINKHLASLGLSKQKRIEAIEFAAGRLPWSMKHMSEFFNSITRKNLGITIKKNARRSEQWSLFQSSLFLWNGKEYQARSMAQFAASDENRKALVDIALAKNQVTLYSTEVKKQRYTAELAAIMKAASDKAGLPEFPHYAQEEMYVSDQEAEKMEKREEESKHSREIEELHYLIDRRLKQMRMGQMKQGEKEKT